MKGYRNLFVCHKTDNLLKCGQFLSGLLHECKSNIERMVERIPTSNYDQLQHFTSNSPWDSFAVMDSVSENLQLSFSEQFEQSNRVFPAPTTPSQGLILDESGWKNQAKRVLA